MVQYKCQDKKVVVILCQKMHSHDTNSKQTFARWTVLTPEPEILLLMCYLRRQCKCLSTMSRGDNKYCGKTIVSQKALNIVFFVRQTSQLAYLASPILSWCIATNFVFKSIMYMKEQTLDLSSQPIPDKFFSLLVQPCQPTAKKSGL